MGEINRSIEKMSIGESGGGGSMMNSMADASGGTTTMLQGKVRATSGMPPHSTLLQNTGSTRYSSTPHPSNHIGFFTFSSI
jgi:hypothetical protein